MAISVADLVAILRLQDQLTPELASAMTKVEAAGKRFQKTGAQIARTGDKLTTSVTLPIVAIAAASFKMAADAEENANKFNVVMGSSADAVRERLEALTATIPLTRAEMEGLSAGVQDMLVPMGVAREQAAGMSADMVQLAGDLGSFNNVGTDQVLEAMQSALAGSSEPMRRFGVDTRVTRLQALALSEGLIEQGEVMDETARAQAVLIAIQRDSTDSMGDAANTVDSAANSTRFLMRDLRQLAILIGNEVIPIVRPMIQSLSDAVKWFSSLDPATKRWLVQIGLLAAALGPVLSILGRIIGVGGSVVSTLASMRTGFANAAAAAGGGTATAFQKLVMMLTGPVGIAIALGVVALAITSFIAKEGGLLDNWAAGTKETLGEIRAGAQEADAGFNELSDSFRGTFPEMIETLSTLRGANVDFEESVRRLELQFKEGTVQGDALRLALDELGLSEKEVETVTTNTAVAVDTAKKSADGFKGTASDLERAMWALANSARAVEGEFVDITEIEVDWGNIGPPTSVPPLIDSVAKSMERYNVQVPDTNRLIAELTNLWESGEVPAAQMNKIVNDQIDELTRLGVMTPEVAKELNVLARETGGATEGFAGMFGELRTGIPAVDGFLGKVDGLIGGFGGIISSLFGGGEGGGIGGAITGFFDSITGGLEGGAGGLFDSIASIFGGGGGEGGGGGIPGIFASLGGGSGEGFLGGLSGILGGGGEGGGIGGLLSGILGGGGGGDGGGGGLGGMLSGLLGGLGQGGAGGFIGGLSSVLGAAANFIPVIGPLISAFAGPLFKGIKALGGKIGGFFKGLFGGVSEAEQSARDMQGSFNELAKSILDDQQLIEAGGEQWKINNIAQRDVLLALGGTQEELTATWERFKDAAKDPAVAEQMADFWGSKFAEVQAAMESTGMTLTDLRNLAINKSKEMSITVAEAFAAIADGTIETMEKATEAVVESTTTVADTVAETATKSADVLIDEMDRAAGTVSETIAGLDLEIPIEFDLGDFPDLGDVGGKGGGGKGEIPHLASGGIVMKPTLAMIGEAGPEAVVPLGGGAGSSPIIIQVESLLDGEKIAENQVKVLKRLGIG